MSETTTGEATSCYPFQPLAFERPSPEEALSTRRPFLPACAAGAASAPSRLTRCPLPWSRMPLPQRLLRPPEPISSPGVSAILSISPETAGSDPWWVICCCRRLCRSPGLIRCQDDVRGRSLNHSPVSKREVLAASPPPFPGSRSAFPPHARLPGLSIGWPTFVPPTHVSLRSTGG
jgi:hypothetical protein